MAASDEVRGPLVLVGGLVWRGSKNIDRVAFGLLFW